MGQMKGIGAPPLTAQQVIDRAGSRIATPAELASISTAQGNATEGRIYGGDCGLIHIEDGKRAGFGYTIAVWLDQLMRRKAVETGARTQAEADSQDLCPGCYMVAIFNAAVELARQNKQSFVELGRSMAAAFNALADGNGVNIESIGVVLDASANFSVPTTIGALGLRATGNIEPVFTPEDGLDADSAEVELAEGNTNTWQGACA